MNNIALLASPSNRSEPFFEKCDGYVSELFECVNGTSSGSNETSTGASMGKPNVQQRRSPCHEGQPKKDLRVSKSAERSFTARKRRRKYVSELENQEATLKVENELCKKQLLNLHADFNDVFMKTIKCHHALKDKHELMMFVKMNCKTDWPKWRNLLAQDSVGNGKFYDTLGTLVKTRTGGTNARSSQVLIVGTKPKAEIYSNI